MHNPIAQIKDKNRRSLLTLVSVGMGMMALAYASVPLYKLFCQVTGFGGTPTISTLAADEVLERKIKIRFDANMDKNLAWKFQPNQLTQSSYIGESVVATYQATNLSDRPLTGMATFNVSPSKAAAYFVKLDCFCFTEQTLQPGQSMEMPVLYYVDPSIAEDNRLDDIKSMTLSYTFYEKPTELVTIGSKITKTAKITKITGETALP